MPFRHGGGTFRTWCGGIVAEDHLDHVRDSFALFDTALSGESGGWQTLVLEAEFDTTSGTVIYNGLST
jgi:hypothetical protein